MKRLEQLTPQLSPARMPEKIVLQGRYVRLEPLNTEKHYRSLYENFIQTPNLFEYMLEGPLTTLEEFRERCLAKENDPTRIYLISSKVSEPNDYIGISGIANIDPINKKLELSRGVRSYKLQSTTASSEIPLLVF